MKIKLVVDVVIGILRNSWERLGMSGDKRPRGDGDCGDFYLEIGNSTDIGLRPKCYLRRIRLK